MKESQLVATFFVLSGGVVLWKSAKQTIVPISVMKPKFVWLRNFVAEIRVVDSMRRSFRMFRDNSAAVFFSKNNKRTSALRLMDVKFLNFRKMVKNGEMEIQFMSPDLMVAYPFTKA